MACYRFNAQKAITASLNLFLYSTLVSLGTNYLIANLATATIFTVVNYMSGISRRSPHGMLAALPRSLIRQLAHLP